MSKKEFKPNIFLTKEENKTLEIIQLIKDAEPALYNTLVNIDFLNDLLLSLADSRYRILLKDSALMVTSEYRDKYRVQAEQLRHQSSKFQRRITKTFKRIIK